MNVTPGRLIGWSLATILAAIAVGCVLAVGGIAFETIRGLVN